MCEDYPQCDGKYRILVMIRRGLDCLEGKHELVACQLHMFGVMACKHCAYILPEGYCECGHPDKDECDDGRLAGNLHLGIDKNAGGIRDPDYTKVMGKEKV